MKAIRRKAFEGKWLSERRVRRERGREREGGECKLMEKRHEDYYRLISSHDNDRKLEGERGSERGGNGGRGGN